MKFFTTSFFLLFLFSFDLFANESKFYSISTCTSTTYEDALRCKNIIKKSASKEIYIIQSNDTYFRTTYGKFDSYKEIKQFEKTLPKTIKEQTPFIKEFHTNDDSILLIEKYLPSDFNNAVAFKINEESYDQPNDQPNNESITLNQDQKSEPTTHSIVKINYQEDTTDTKKDLTPTKISPIKITPKVTKTPIINSVKVSTPTNKNSNKEITKKNTLESHSNTLLPPFEELKNYEMIYIKIDSKTNKLDLEGVVGDTLTPLAQFVVSTGKKTIEKPTGLGKITSISLAPNWYPTQKTIDHFKETKGIELPKVVLPGDKYNYMGAAKINLSHRVQGKEIYRIHGTLDETTIGTNESSGCIRMKNNEVLALAKMLKKYIGAKGGTDKIKVFLK